MGPQLETDVNMKCRHSLIWLSVTDTNGGVVVTGDCTLRTTLRPVCDGWPFCASKCDLRPSRQCAGLSVVVKCQVITEMTGFRNMAPCSLVEAHRRFRGVYCLHPQRNDQVALMMEAVRTSETSVCLHKTTRRHVPQGCLAVYNVYLVYKL
jgi:hypothetical protein